MNYLASAELAVGGSAAELAVSDRDFCLTSPRSHCGVGAEESTGVVCCRVGRTVPPATHSLKKRN